MNVCTYAFAAVLVWLSAAGLDREATHEPGDPPSSSVADSAATTVRYDSSLFAWDPPGCDAYLQGTADADGNPTGTYWGGCNTNGCRNVGQEDADCQTEEPGDGMLECGCPGGGGRATCWATVHFGADGETVTGVDCHRNGCGTTCDIILWQEGEFYPCRC